MRSGTVPSPAYHRLSITSVPPIGPIDMLKQIRSSSSSTAKPAPRGLWEFALRTGAIMLAIEVPRILCADSIQLSIDICSIPSKQRKNTFKSSGASSRQRRCPNSTCHAKPARTHCRRPLLSTCHKERGVCATHIVRYRKYRMRFVNVCLEATLEVGICKRSGETTVTERAFDNGIVDRRIS